MDLLFLIPLVASMNSNIMVFIFYMLLSEPNTDFRLNETKENAMLNHYFAKGTTGQCITMTCILQNNSNP